MSSCWCSVTRFHHFLRVIIRTLTKLHMPRIHRQLTWTHGDVDFPCTRSQSIAFHRSRGPVSLLDNHVRCLPTRMQKVLPACVWVYFQRMLECRFRVQRHTRVCGMQVQRRHVHNVHPDMRGKSAIGVGDPLVAVPCACSAQHGFPLLRIFVRTADL